MRKPKMLFFAIAMLSLLTGCMNPFGSEGSEIDVAHAPGLVGNPLQPSPGSEFVSSSQRNILTSGGRFRVDATLSSLTSGTEFVTTPRRYKFFSNVQGVMMSNGGSQ